MRRILIFLALVGLAGCATIEGAGRDISKAGQFVSDGAREVRRAF
ncbi:MAG: entericidin A/B family lipoprotein [Pseudomonadota bacterium]